MAVNATARLWVGTVATSREPKNVPIIKPGAIAIVAEQELVAAEAILERAVEVDAAPITRELALRVADNARDLGAQGFARWALGLPWREFCAVVQLCSGRTRRTLEAA